MILDLILIGLAVTLEPIPITACILIVSTPGGVRKGLVFVLAWMATVVAVIAAAVSLTGGQPLLARSAPSTAALVVKLVLGLVLVGVAVRRQRRMHRPRKQPTWMARLDTISPWSVAALSVFLQPWALVMAGAATVLNAQLSTFGEWALLVGYCLLCSASLLALELHMAFAPEVAAARLARLRAWIDSHRDQAIVVLSLLLGLWLVGKSSYGLVAA